MIVPDWTRIGDADLGSALPLIICDACGLPLSGAGSVYWVQHTTGDLLPFIWHAHDGSCSERVERAIRRSHGRSAKREAVERWLEVLGTGGLPGGGACPQAPNDTGMET